MANNESEPSTPGSTEKATEDSRIVATVLDWFNRNRSNDHLPEDDAKAVINSVRFHDSYRAKNLHKVTLYGCKAGRSFEPIHLNRAYVSADDYELLSEAYESLKWSAQEKPSEPVSPDRRLEDLVMLVRRMVVRLRARDDREHDPKSHELADAATDYLRRKDLASGADILRAEPVSPQPQTDERVKKMVELFLGWRLPESFNPDGGISFEPIGNKGHTTAEYKREPTGTNLFDYTQAMEMVRYIVAESPLPQPTKCRHEFEEHTSSEPVGAGMLVESYWKCSNCGELADSPDDFEPYQKTAARDAWNSALLNPNSSAPRAGEER